MHFLGFNARLQNLMKGIGRSYIRYFFFTKFDINTLIRHDLQLSTTPAVASTFPMERDTASKQWRMDETNHRERPSLPHRKSPRIISSLGYLASNHLFPKNITNHYWSHPPTLNLSTIHLPALSLLPTLSPRLTATSNPTGMYTTATPLQQRNPVVAANSSNNLTPCPLYATGSKLVSA